MNETFRQELERLTGEDILFDEPLSRHTSIGVGGCADALVFPGNREQLHGLLSFLRREEIPCVPVGNWTNLIVRDGGVRGVVIGLKNMNASRLFQDPSGDLLLQAEAGASLSDLVNLSATEGLTGLEFCAGIPGSVGGAIIMNAGAYGREIKDALEELTLMDVRGMARTWPRGQLQFEYRHFVLPEKDAVILDATFRLSRSNKEIVKEKIADIRRMRKEKHPLEYRSAGSVFKNPQGQPAGKIIDELGLKGLQIGGAKVSEKHGNFIVNVGQAKARDILDLIRTIQDKVLREKGIHLEVEVITIGEDL
ncbi:MAG: UDP-N-acetylmuramate dehydrogenase [Syntrophales bacterium]|jgi:UDP-N-acetylmuramate dehydrogenase|nr:UDP-N-acetylmuramate dehydrogenase [Syntrophales bacterium]MCK9390418.1 UDP-N-acetylmuramate dehydrogenase [Syntrophales bacterium]